MKKKYCNQRSPNMRNTPHVCRESFRMHFSERRLIEARVPTTLYSDARGAQNEPALRGRLTMDALAQSIGSAVCQSLHTIGIALSSCSGQSGIGSIGLLCLGLLSA